MEISDEVDTRGAFLLRPYIMLPFEPYVINYLEFNFLAAVAEVAAAGLAYAPPPEGSVYYVGRADGARVSAHTDLAELLASQKDNNVYLFEERGAPPAKVHVSSSLNVWTSGTLRSRFESYLNFIKQADKVRVRFLDEHGARIAADTPCAELAARDVRKVYVTFAPFRSVDIDVASGVRLQVDDEHVEVYADEDGEPRRLTLLPAAAAHLASFVQTAAPPARVTASTLQPIFDGFASLDWSGAAGLEGDELIAYVARTLHAAEDEWKSLADFAAKNWGLASTTVKGLVDSELKLRTDYAHLETENQRLKRSLFGQLTAELWRRVATVFGNQLRNEAFIAVFYAALLTLVVQRSRYAMYIIACVWAYAAFAVLATLFPGPYRATRQAVVTALSPPIYPPRERLRFPESVLDEAAKAEFNGVPVEWDRLVKTARVRPTPMQKIAISIATIIPLYWKNWINGVRQREAVALGVAKAQVELRVAQYKQLNVQLSDLMARIAQLGDAPEAEPLKAEALGLSRRLFAGMEAPPH